MSKRRKAGDWVWLKPNSGFVGESNKYKAEIQDSKDPLYPDGFDYCCMCDDKKCKEWDTLLTEEVNGKRYTLCHVSECQMLDEPYKEEK